MARIAVKAAAADVALLAFYLWGVLRFLRWLVQSGEAFSDVEQP